VVFDNWLQTSANSSSIKISVPRGSDFFGEPVAIGEAYQILGNPALLFSMDISELRADFSFIDL
jgi:hypothetical protein